MKTIFTLCVTFLCFSTAALSQGVAINENGTPRHSSAILDVSSTQKGFLPPRMTTAQRDSVRNPADGLVIFNLTTGCLDYFFGGSWYEWCGAITYPEGTIHCTDVPTTVVDVINPATGKTWMDRNLGASRAATGSNDSAAYGDLYQWGRRADDHQCRNSATTATVSSTPQPAHGHFITTPNSPPWDWLIPQDNNLWQGQNGINNPCPNGYRIPTEAELNAERSSWVSQSNTGAFVSPLKFTAAGVRSNDGTLQWVGTSGYYWTSTLTEFKNPRLLYFTTGGALMNTLNRNTGYSVRCIKETAQIQGSISTLDCNTATATGTLTQGVAASGASSSVPYTGGNGGSHAGQTVASTGVTGLTATLAAGNFTNATGTLLYTISGTPSTSGTASFALNIGGLTCTLTRIVNAPAGPAYPAGTVHCTTTPTAVVDVLNPTTGRTWMDRNLGATRVPNSINDSEAYGDLYQWGRRADGHQCRSSVTTSTLTSADQPAHGSFIAVYSSPYDWRSPQNDQLWQGVNGVNNPCPIGYRIPTETELNSERLSWSQNNSTGAFGSPLKLLRAGIRFNSGTIFGGGSNAYYWSSTVSLNIARTLDFQPADATMMTGFRADGRSVRCIKEVAQIPGSINSLDCNTATTTGTLTQGEAASGVSSSVPYTGGNGGAHTGQAVVSNGVTGLTATLAAGSFANGSGTLIYQISGTPASTGTASFALNVGGKTCTLSLTVNTPTGPAYPAGTVHCTTAPTAVVEVLNPVTGKTWMDRNLGASRVAASSSDANAYGDLYQWGRRADGHQCRTSPTTNSLSSTDQPAHGSFILESNSYYDWRSPQNNNLWQGVNGVNNPCPIGFRLPTGNEMNAERLSWNSNNEAGAFASLLKWPLAGRRRSDNGLLWDSGSEGSYWSSTVIVSYPGVLIFSSSDGRFQESHRIFGNSVRCIKEVVPVQGAVNTLNCAGAENNGTLTAGNAASGVSSSIPYTGGNGGAHTGQTVASTGVTGLTATLATGSFANGAGTLVYTITGTPSTSGTASFALNIGGQTCTLNRMVNAPGPSYPAGTVHCTPTPTAVVEVLNPATGKTWMDRNLGAGKVAASGSDAAAYGDLYQWGRRADGHQCRNSATTNILSSTDQPAHGNFILVNTANYDWRSPQNNNLWQGVNGINNPCPTGFRLPTNTEFQAERLSWATNNSWGAFGSPLKLPMSGFRNGVGNMENVSSDGYYWANNGAVNAHYLYFGGTGAQNSETYRSFGFSVRCIKETAQTQGSINTLDCNTATPTGTLTQGEAANGVSSSVPYTGGNGGNHTGQSVTSTGVTGLTATLASGSFANGAGTLVYNITGTPATSGTASFALNIGGKTCTLTRTVNAPAGPAYPAGTVHCTPAPTAVVDVVNPTTGRTWMDRNLGASRVATSSTDAEGFGDLYQWGRRADGHQCRNSANTNTLSSSDQPAHGSFIVSPITTDWRSSENTALWQGVNGVNNPCPVGFRLPSSAELIDERMTWSNFNAAGAIGSPLKMPMAGYRSNSDGLMVDIGTYSIYWSSTINSGKSQSLDFGNSAAILGINNRAYGFSVRCMKDNTPIQGSISALNCSASTPTGTLTQGFAASGVNSSIPYTGGNGGAHVGQTVASTGVAGLTATLATGSFANGAGTLVYTITGTPATSGTASFALNIGGKTCTLTRTVNAPAGPAYPAGTVHCTPAPTAVVDVVNPTTGRTWMDRNLGASRVATSSADAAAYGDLYQWGRSADGHQCRNSDTTSVLSSVSKPGHSKFILSKYDPYSWRTSLNNNAWQGVSGVNNPCPAGYRLPTNAEWVNELFSWPLGNMEDAFASPLKLPATGHREWSSGAIELGASFGLYWSSSVVGKFASYFQFAEDMAGTGENGRAFGYSVRCIKEQPL